jgi:uncharacterized protein (DUF433 family)
MAREYIEQRNGGYYVAGARVSLDSIIYAFRGGESPETIQQNFPSLTLEQVYGAIAFYPGHQAEIDGNIRQGEEDVRRLIPPLSQRKPEAYIRLQRARQQMANRA